MTLQDQKETRGMRTPHRRDISARQDLLGRELRQLFDDYVQEDMPEELQKLALQLQSAMEELPPTGATQHARVATPADDERVGGEQPPATTDAPAIPAVAAGKPSVQG
ncbi:hypothetical protein [Xanthobacter variabilis]|uniref:hypothetical protein n=1 Tax=Xanthobacter variabilis TaxID=3119932 RepID=UPI00374F6558